jgi:N-acetylgalactosamine 4-sulfate 6-O-sulfotransferase
VHHEHTKFDDPPPDTKITGTPPLTSSEIEAMLATIQSAVKSMEVVELNGLPNSTELTLLPNFKNPCWMNGAKSRIGRLDGIGVQRSNNTQNHTPHSQQDELVCLPYFYLAGFPKSGTTDLFAKLLKHPEVTRGKNKEPHYWTRRRFKKIKFSGYQKFFSTAISTINQNTSGDNFHHLVMTDGSASTVWDNIHLFKSKDDPADSPPYLNLHVMQAVQPSAKFLLIVRNPRDRLYSDYLFFQKTFSAEEFHHQVQSGLQILTSCFRDPKKHPLYCMYKNYKSDICRLCNRLRIGLYYVHISILFSVYPKENVYITNLDYYARRKVNVLEDIFQFLDLEAMDRENIEDLVINSTRNKNKAGYKKAGAMLNSTRTLLDEFYRPFNVRLSKLLNNDDLKYE